MKIICLTLLILWSFATVAEEDTSLEEQIKKNTIIEIFDDETPILPDIIKAGIASGMAGSTLSKSGQFYLKLEAYAEHFTQAESSIRYLHVDFVYLQGDNQNKLALKLTPVGLDFKNVLFTDSEIFIGAFPLSTTHDDFLLQNDVFKVSLLATELTQTIPINLAALIIKTNIHLLSAESQKREDQYHQKDRLELFHAEVDLNLKLNNLISIFVDVSQSMYLNDFNTIMSQWAGETKVALGAEFGVKLGDLNALLYLSGGYRKQDRRTEGFMEVGIKISDIFAAPTKANQKKNK